MRCGTFAGPDGSRQPTDLEQDSAETHGKRFATITANLAAKYRKKAATYRCEASHCFLAYGLNEGRRKSLRGSS